MQIRIQSTGQVMYENEFRALFPNTSFTQQLSEALINELGADVVFEGPQATGGTRYQYSQPSGVEQIDGKWFTKHILGPVFTGDTAAADQAAYESGKDADRAAAIRTQRDAKLTSSDWTQVADAPVDKAAWATYRQALRDVPTQTGFPWEVTWPTTP
jgi:hypothetical protein